MFTNLQATTYVNVRRNQYETRLQNIFIVAFKCAEKIEEKENLDLVLVWQKRQA